MGPLVFCMEGVDNGERLGEVRLAAGEITVGWDDALKLPTLTLPAVRETVQGLYDDRVTRAPFVAKMIPYFAFANRGESDMRLWLEEASV